MCDDVRKCRGLKTLNRNGSAGSQSRPSWRAPSALTRLEAVVGFVNNVEPPFTTNDSTIAVTGFQRLERTADFHMTCPNKGTAAPLLRGGRTISPPIRACQAGPAAMDSRSRQTALSDDNSFIIAVLDSHEHNTHRGQA